jgi:hypothetical protein
MSPLPPASHRRSLLICALAAALALAGCGGGDAVTIDGSQIGTTTGTTTAPGTKTTATAGEGAKPKTGAHPASCEARLGDLVGSLDRLRVRLATGLSYEQYAAAVKKTKAVYGALDADRLPPDCLVAAGADAERSLNRYIEAANSWGQCLADAGCDARVVEPELQRQWQVASHWLSEAHEGLKSLS